MALKEMESNEERNTGGQPILIELPLTKPGIS